MAPIKTNQCCRKFMVLILLFSQIAFAQEEHTAHIPKLENPISVTYLKKKLPKSGPKLVLNTQIQKQLKKKLKTDPVSQN